MTDTERNEIVAAARAYERALAGPRGDAEAEERLRLAEFGLGGRIYGRHGAAGHAAVRVAGVVYLVFSAGSVFRIPLAECPDLAVHPIEAAT